MYNNTTTLQQSENFSELVDNYLPTSKLMTTSSKHNGRLVAYVSDWDDKFSRLSNITDFSRLRELRDQLR